MGNEVLVACPLFITDPVTGEQREVKPIGDIGWTEIQPTSDSSVKELADALKKVQMPPDKCRMPLRDSAS